MIYTRFGTKVNLISPVNWDTGWVTVAAPLGMDEMFNREMHISELKADDGINEIKVASDALERHLCRDCNKPMELIQQEQRNAPPLDIVTCKNRSCSLWSVTLTTAKYDSLTDAEWSEYRISVARLKKTLHMEDK